MLSNRISSFISRAAAISLLLASAVSASADSREQDKAETDTIPLFRNVAVSVDAIGLGQLAISDYGQYEAALRVNLRDKYFPVVEIGYGRADAFDVTTKVGYKTGAPYGKLGMDFNILKNKHDIYRLYAGFRYALTYYKFDVYGTDVTDPVWGDKVDYRAEDVKCNYHWLEGVFGVDAKIWGPFRLGWSFRYRFRVAHNDGTVGNTWYVPGYGKQGATRLGGTFNVILEL